MSHSVCRAWGYSHVKVNSRMRQGKMRSTTRTGCQEKLPPVQRRFFLAFIVVASCIPGGKGFFPPVPSSSFATSTSRAVGRSDEVRTAVNTLIGRQSRVPAGRLEQQHWGRSRTHDRRSWWLSMMAAGIGGRMGPGKGTQVVLLRHGMSTFNKLNIFTGWCDVPLTDEGKTEAMEAGKLLAAAGYRFDVAHSSVLKRACTSLHRLLDGCGQPYVPIKTSWRLNERHYGALQGRNKATLEEAMGEIVVEWRRAYGTRPPPMTDVHPHWPLISLDSRYRGLQIPESESLRDTANRVMEYWESDVVPDIRAGKRVIVVAHANTLRSLVKRLDGVEENAIRNINIPTGEPFVYDFDANLRTIGEPDEFGFRGKFVGDMMEEKEAAVDEYTRREKACFDKWEKNPEVVPEECMCDEDWEEARSERFGEAQASLGLDRYSVGYDLPLPSILPSSSEPVANAVEARDFGGPVLETMAGWDTDDMEAGTEGRASPGPEGGRVPDRNETSPYPSR